MLRKVFLLLLTLLPLRSFAEFYIDSVISFHVPHVFYAAFPAFYLDINNNVVLSFSGRSSASHYASADSTYNYISYDCGKTWLSSKSVLPPMVLVGSDGFYRKVASAGWSTDNKIKSEFSKIEHNITYYPDSFYEYIFDGKKWEKIRLNFDIKFKATMNYNNNSYTKLNNGDQLISLYYVGLDDRDHIIFAKRINNERRWIFYGGPVNFNEAALSYYDGVVYAFLRSRLHESKGLFLSKSFDNGETWSSPVELFIKGYPASVLSEKNGLVITVSDRGSRPFSIVSYEYKYDGAINLVGTLFETIGVNVSDFGYPTTVRCDDFYLTSFYSPGIGRAAYPVVVRWRK